MDDPRNITGRLSRTAAASVLRLHESKVSAVTNFPRWSKNLQATLSSVSLGGCFENNAPLALMTTGMLSSSSSPFAAWCASED
eukprot:8194142-Pyramimonas_sp.AAC.1